MRTFDVQGIEINAPAKKVFEFLRMPENLPQWAHAFTSAGKGGARLEGPAGAVDIAHPGARSGVCYKTTDRATLFRMPRGRAAHPESDGRRTRADGARSRRAILNAATRLATVEGLDGLSIARLADHVGMSKSGLFAHFRSKEDLQIATIDAAAEMFEREVWQPGRAAPAGARRVLSVCEAFLSYLERAVFPGGCFFVAAAAELDAKAGPVRDHLRDVYSRILEALADVVREAQAMGEIDATEDVAQLTYELDSLMLGANFAYVFFRDPAALDRARRAIRRRLADAAPPRLARRDDEVASTRSRPRRRAATSG